MSALQCIYLFILFIYVYGAVSTAGVPSKKKGGDYSIKCNYNYISVVKCNRMLVVNPS